MKPTSPLSLLLFLQLASATPIPISIERIYPAECHSKSCIISLLTSPHNTHHPPPSHFTEPPFPKQQLEGQAPEAPISKPYLLSLINPASKPGIQKPPVLKQAEKSKTLPAKLPTALAELRAADIRKYWESLRPSYISTTSSPKTMQIHTCDMGIVGGEIVGSERFYYMRRTRMGTRRDYPDLMVIGIVVLFLAVVVALEAVERCGDGGGILCGRRQRRGAIYLEDDDELFVIKRPFELSSSSRTPIDGYRDEKEQFVYDSDAFERV